MNVSEFCFSSHQYTSPITGPKLIVTGAVHGNETCGTTAIRRVIKEIESGQRRLQRGVLTLVPVCNPLAYQRGERHGDRNLNRRLIPSSNPREFEDYVANWLCPLLAAHQVLLDLHSFRGEGDAFVLLGPENNSGDTEPFSFAAEELALASCLGVTRMVDGWLSTYDRGVQRRLQRLGTHPDPKALANANPLFGVGTTEYMRSVGGYAVTLECGSHDDPLSAEVAYRAIINTLALSGMIADGPLNNLPPDMESLRIYDVVDKFHIADAFVREWTSFDEVRRGDLIGIRQDGSEVRAVDDGRMIFPDAGADAGEEWFYLTRYTQRANGE